jgi:hypothetical protein
MLNVDCGDRHVTGSPGLSSFSPLALDGDNVPLLQRERAFRDPVQFRIAHEFKRPCVTDHLRPATGAGPEPPVARGRIRAADRVACHQRRSLRKADGRIGGIIWFMLQGLRDGVLVAVQTQRNKPAARAF